MILELRYPESFLMWDCAGKLVRLLQAVSPGLTVSKSQPSQVILRSGSSGEAIMYSPGTVNVTSGNNPKNVGEVTKNLDGLVAIVLRELAVESLSRIGHRVKYIKHFPSEQAAIAGVATLAKNHGLLISQFAEVDDAMNQKKIRAASLRFEDERGGITLGIESGKIEATVDKSYLDIFDLTIPDPYHFVQLDFDVFQNGPVDAEACLPGELIRSNLKMLEARFLNKLNCA